MKTKAIVCVTLAAMLIFAPGSLAEEVMPIAVDEPLELPPMDEPLAVPTDEPADDPAEALAEENFAESDVAEAQSLMIDLGLLTAEVADGQFGPKTVDALRTFQTQNGLVATGRLDDATLSKVRQVSATGRSVRAIQQRLHDLGYLSGAADGKFGEKSTEALKLFQRLNGQNATGLMDAESLSRLFSDEAYVIPVSLMPGDKGETVLAMQRRLSQYGFTDEEPDGAYGNKTIGAVLAFQKHLIDQGLGQSYNLAADGNASPITQFFLFSGNYSSYLRDIPVGIPDDEARRMERRLYALGYMDLTPDEIADNYTLSALALFREKAGLPASEAIDRAVIDALFSDNAPVADHCVPHDIAAGDSGVAVREVETALVSGGMTTKLPDGSYNSDVVSAIERLHDYLSDQGSPRAVLFMDGSSLTVEAQEALHEGLLGYRADVSEEAPVAEILRVQRRLHTLFYLDHTAIDGKYGDMSRAAMTAFQTDNGLPQTGVADAATQALLFSKDAPARALPYRVEVSLARQRVTVYERAQDGTYIRTQTFVCSTGLGNSTPRGIFLDGFPVNRWHYFEKFNCWAQYSFDIEGDIMFHSVIYSSASEGSLRSSSLYALGSKASHGCIRLKVPDAKWLFEHCPRGSLAIVIS